MGHKLKLADTNNSMAVTREKGGGEGEVRERGVKYMVAEDDLTLGSGK